MELKDLFENAEKMMKEMNATSMEVVNEDGIIKMRFFDEDKNLIIETGTF